jgi:hypothetical protein
MSRARDLADLGGSADAGGLTGRNLIINGAMIISQRGTSFTPNTSVNYSLDRYATLETTDGDMTISQDTSVVPTGFQYSLKAVTGTADTSIAASQRMIIFTRIEGYNVAQLELGTANAKKFTLSFYVRSSLTGTFGGAFQNSASNRNYPFTYTINSANTWERKTITITGDTSGTWNKTNGTGLQICWGLGVGSDHSGTAGAWAAGDVNSATGGTSVIGTASATWYITGVQLEVGETATDFEHEAQATTLAKCQRYYEISGVVIVTNIATRYPSGQWAVRKNHRPDITFTAAAGSGATISPMYDGGNVLDNAGQAAWFQSVVHSIDALAVVFGDAEL